MKSLYIEGYTDGLSCRAGDQVGFHISTSAAEYSVEIIRLGAQREKVWSQEGLKGVEHPVPANASSHGCGWPVAFSLQVPETWRSGYYLATLRASDRGGEFTQRNRRTAEGELTGPTACGAMIRPWRGSRAMYWSGCRSERETLFQILQIDQILVPP